MAATARAGKVGPGGLLSSWRYMYYCGLLILMMKSNNFANKYGSSILFGSSNY